MNKQSIIDKCLNSGNRLTPLRQKVIDVMMSNKKHTSAYSILDEINAEEKKPINVSTLYRILDFWMSIGVIHKVNATNTFVLCNDSHENHNHILLHCRDCDSVIEKCEISRKFPNPMFNDFHLSSNEVIEFHGLCSACSSNK